MPDAAQVFIALSEACRSHHSFEYQSIRYHACRHVENLHPARRCTTENCPLIAKCRVVPSF